MTQTDAYGFLEYYAKRTTEPFSPEDLIHAAEQAGIVFKEKRAWGPIFLAAWRDGLIRRSGLFARSSSNGSVRPGWVRA